MEVPAFAVFCTSRKESGGFTHGDCLLLDLLLCIVKDFLLHGSKVAGDRTEIVYKAFRQFFVSHIGTLPLLPHEGFEMLVGSV